MIQNMRGMIFHYAYMATEAWPGKRQKFDRRTASQIHCAPCGMMGQ
jgi:hypothetical protein